MITYCIIRRDLIQNSNISKRTNPKLDLDAKISLHPHIVKQLEDLSNSENIKNENENENENEVENTWSHKKGVRRSMGKLYYYFAPNMASQICLIFKSKMFICQLILHDLLFCHHDSAHNIYRLVSVCLFTEN